MPRTIPSCPTKPIGKSDRETRTYEIELITPLFGGGVETRTVDTSMPIRGTSIRGQLQFWWRATVGARCTDLKELRSEQSRVWGDTEKASPVEVVVHYPLRQGVALRPCAEFEPDHNRLGMLRSMPRWDARLQQTSYALFPFQGQRTRDGRQVEVRPAEFVERLAFQLDIRFPSALWPALEPAIWAWINLGGLGSRTRRGCGSLKCTDWSPKDVDDFRQQLGKYLPKVNAARDWPTLAAAVLLENRPRGSLDAWARTINLLKDFRQGVDVGRNAGQQPNRPGRSRWPEPEVIRGVTRERSASHQRLGHIPDDACPRGEFGLPIVFHFKDHGDPQDSQLLPEAVQGVDHPERMASPLILKPLALNAGQSLPLIARLRTRPLGQVRLCRGDQTLRGRIPVRGGHLANYRNSPLKDRSTAGSALEAFLAFAVEKGFREVKP
jgi:CRISPR-associated protein Cmr1